VLSLSFNYTTRSCFARSRPAPAPAARRAVPQPANQPGGEVVASGSFNRQLSTNCDETTSRQDAERTRGPSNIRCAAAAQPGSSRVVAPPGASARGPLCFTRRYA
jgi:hypothetical protein